MIHDASLAAGNFDEIEVSVGVSNRLIAERYPGDTGSRQPVHTVYGGAHLFAPDIAARLGASALKTLHAYAPDASAFGHALNLTEESAARIYPAVVSKLTREPVEDIRVDFEDGFGTRSDAEEDRYALQVGADLAAGLARSTLPFFFGIRIKSLAEETKHRALRTLGLVVGKFVNAADAPAPLTFLLTLPKITTPEQVSALAAACDVLEAKHRLEPGTLRIELMVETTQAIFAADGCIALPRLVAAGRGRVVAAHFGTYDYTAACGITASEQHMLHPACDFAKHVMQVALAGTGIRLSDGATNVMPVGPHRERDDASLTDRERDENRETVHRAWRLHAAHIRHSLATGFYQGWDLHPAQLPTRYAAVYGFFLDGVDQASARLRAFVEKAAQATLVGDVFDDAATGQGLLNFFLRAINCGAMTDVEVAEKTGLTVAELRSRSFNRILADRRLKI